MSAAEPHNRLAREFATKLVKEVIETGGGHADIMVVLESIIVAVMILNNQVFGMADRVAVELVDSAVHRATERFIEQQ